MPSQSMPGPNASTQFSQLSSLGSVARSCLQDFPWVTAGSVFFCNAGCVSVQNFPTLVEIDQLKSFSVSTKGKFYEEKGKR